MKKRLALAANLEHCRAAVWTFRFHRRFAILHGDSLNVVVGNLFLSAAFYTVKGSHMVFSPPLKNLLFKFLIGQRVFSRKKLWGSPAKNSGMNI
jgi:hypothetical protein